MPIIATHELTPEIANGPLGHQIYNALDATITFEVWESLQSLYNTPPEVYGFSRALQAPVLEMMLRGFRVDQYERQRTIEELRGHLTRVDHVLQSFATAAWGRPLNPRSQKQLQSFFYTTMRIPEIWTSKKGKKVLSMDRETLEKLEVYFHARPIVAAILAYRDLAKKIDVLETDCDSDGRMRSSFNIGGTETGRLSSSASVTGSGTNLQNVTEKLRRIFVADPGWKICGMDLEQAESREVGWLIGTLFDDWSYLDACEGGDLHTTTAKLIWPNLAWIGDPKRDRELAESPFYRHYSYRDMSKRGGHGTTYFGTPFTMARHLKVPVGLMEAFQDAFFGAYPGIPKWHRWVAEQLQTTQQITNAFGVTRHFFGRPGDDATLREAIAHSPQSSTGMRLNLGMWRIWRYMGDRVQLLTQLHDAVYFQYREDDDEEKVITQAQALLDVPLRHGSRVFTVPSEAKVGWNWAPGSNPKKGWVNPDGLEKFKGKDPRTRQTLLERTL